MTVREEAYAGLDVHKRTVSAAIRMNGRETSKIRRVKVQIKGFLLEYGYPEPDGLRYRSKQAVQQLHTMTLPRRLPLCLEALLEELASLERPGKKVMAELKRMADEKRYAEAEVYRPERFATANQVVKYPGLAPLVRQSGETSRNGPTIKGGRNALRGMAVEASWIWIGRDRHARRSPPDAIYTPLDATSWHATW